MKWHGLERFALLVLVFAAACAETHTTQGVILPADEAASVLDQCTREVPIRATGYWKSARKDVAALERVLPSALDSAFKARRRTDSGLHPQDYRRQYIGVHAQGRRFIYVNGIHRSWTQKEVPYWRWSAVSVCDGGSHFWGAIYDVQERRIVGIEFNSRMAMQMEKESKTFG